MKNWAWFQLIDFLCARRAASQKRIAERAKCHPSVIRDVLDLRTRPNPELAKVLADVMQEAGEFRDELARVKFELDLRNTDFNGSMRPMMLARRWETSQKRGWHERNGRIPASVGVGAA